jgi:thiazole synthase
MASVEILLNGESRRLEAGTTVEALVRELGLVPDRLAVEYNLHILKKKHWATTALAHGDRVEIVHFVGGGASGPRSRRGFHSTGPNQRKVSSHASD